MRLSLLCLISVGLLALGCSKDEETVNEAAAEQPAAATPAAEAAPAPEPPAAESTAQPAPKKEALIPAQQKLDQQTQDELADTVIETLVRPIYPQALRDQSIEGEAVVEYRITPQGTIGAAKVLSATHPLFSEAALAAVKQWTFKSASGKEEVSPQRLRQAFPFVIRRPDPDEIHGDGEDYPVLGGLLRPPHTGEPGRALIELKLDRTSVVEEVRIVEKSGEINEEMIQMALKEWLFLPYFRDGQYQPATVRTELVFTDGGNVLVQYPYRENAAASAAAK